MKKMKKIISLIGKLCREKERKTVRAKTVIKSGKRREEFCPFADQFELNYGGGINFFN